MALEWSDVDLAKRQLRVERSDWKGHVTAPKGGRWRCVPLTVRLAAALQEHRHLNGRRRAVFGRRHSPHPTARSGSCGASRSEGQPPERGSTCAPTHVLLPFGHAWCGRKVDSGAGGARRLGNHATVHARQPCGHRKCDSTTRRAQTDRGNQCGNAERALGLKNEKPAFWRGFFIRRLVAGAGFEHPHPDRRL